MRRPRKHRHHPDIWRERHMAESLGKRRRVRWDARARAYRASGRPTLTIADMRAAYDHIMEGTVAV